MKPNAVWLIAAAALTLGAGCIGASEDSADIEGLEQTLSPEGEQEQRLGLQGTQCTQGGGQSVHPRDAAGVMNLSATVPDPWRVADVIEDTGERHVYSEIPDPTTPTPEEGHTWGHYHATLECESWTLDGAPVGEILFGFVGPKVQTPSFAPDSAGDEYLTTVIATDNQALYERLQRGGIDAMKATGSIEEDQAGARVHMLTDHNGEYLSIYQLDELGPFDEESVRLWFQTENVDGTYTPIAVDMQVQGGTHYGSLEEGYFHHSGTAHHWPLPGAYGHSAAVHYEGFDVAFTWGPTPDVEHEERYDH